jgi:hypothetical protein
MRKETADGIIKLFVESYTASTKEKRGFAEWRIEAAIKGIGLHPEEVRHLEKEAVSRLHFKHWRRELAY